MASPEFENWAILTFFQKSIFGHVKRAFFENLILRFEAIFNLTVPNGVEFWSEHDVLA